MSKSKDKSKDKLKDKLKDKSKNLLHQFSSIIEQATCKDELFDDDTLKKYFKKIPKNIYKLIKSQVLNEEYESVIITLNYAIKLRDKINNKD